jgi:hypothetical protein
MPRAGGALASVIQKPLLLQFVLEEEGKPVRRRRFEWLIFSGSSEKTGPASETKTHARLIDSARSCERIDGPVEFVDSLATWLFLGFPVSERFRRSRFVQSSGRFSRFSSC